jgi:hypothetical protein
MTASHRRVAIRAVICLCGIFSASAVTATAQANVQTVPLASGLGILNVTTGAVTYCSVSYQTATPPTPPNPIGKCLRIGSAGASAAGYVVTANPANVVLYIVNKSTNAIYQCATAYNGTDGTPYGSCKQIGSVAS